MEAEDLEFLGIGQSVTYPAPLVPNRKELSRMTRSPGPTRVCVWEGSSLYPTVRMPDSWAVPSMAISLAVLVPFASFWPKG